MDQVESPESPGADLPPPSAKLFPAEEIFSAAIIPNGNEGILDLSVSNIPPPTPAREEIEEEKGGESLRYSYGVPNYERYLITEENKENEPLINNFPQFLPKDVPEKNAGFKQDLPLKKRSRSMEQSQFYSTPSGPRNYDITPAEDVLAAKRKKESEKDEVITSVRNGNYIVSLVMRSLTHSNISIVRIAREYFCIRKRSKNNYSMDIPVNDFEQLQKAFEIIRSQKEYKSNMEKNN